jgi:hypothetical protein
MKHLWIVPLLAMALLACGCGKGGEGGEAELSIEEYFQSVEAIWDEYEEREAEADQLFSEGLGEPDALKDAFVVLLLAYGRALDRQDSLAPPREAEKAHEELLSAAEEVLEVTEDIADRLRGAESQSEIQEVIAAFEDRGEIASRRLRNACFALQAIADEKNIDVGLDCE